MSAIFHLDSSIRAVGLQGRAVASTLEDSAGQHLEELNAVTREMGLLPLPPTALALATHVLGLGGYAAPKVRGEWTVEEARAMALATELADEMLAATPTSSRSHFTIMATLPPDPPASAPAPRRR